IRSRREMRATPVATNNKTIRTVNTSARLLSPPETGTARRMRSPERCGSEFTSVSIPIGLSPSGSEFTSVSIPIRLSPSHCIAPNYSDKGQTRVRFQRTTLRILRDELKLNLKVFFIATLRFTPLHPEPIFAQFLNYYPVKPASFI